MKNYRFYIKTFKGSEDLYRELYRDLSLLAGDFKPSTKINEYPDGIEITNLPDNFDIKRWCKRYNSDYLRYLSLEESNIINENQIKQIIREELNEILKEEFEPGYFEWKEELNILMWETWGIPLESTTPKYFKFLEWYKKGMSPESAFDLIREKYLEEF